jgi:polyphosphate:AMP phosphotransferase
MFESAELGHAIDKATYEKKVPALRQALLKAQYDLLGKAQFPTIILINGVDGAGKGETVQTLLEWMDPRHVRVHAFGDPTDEERARPPMYRFWRKLPPKGRVGIFFGNWYTAPIIDRVEGTIKTPEFDDSLTEIRRFEQMLCDEGALILKFWFHLSKERQKERLNELSESKATRWRVTDEEWRRFRKYDRYRKISEHALRETSSAHAPWIVLEGWDARYRDVTVGSAVELAIRERVTALGEKKVSRRPVRAPVTVPSGDGVTLVKSMDLSRKLPKKDYEEELARWQRKLALLTRKSGFDGRSLITVFEGSDAAGKGGSIRRVASALDPRRYEIVPIAAPSEEERAQPYLWRFWRHLPAKGRVTIFDRSWYGRVLVERVEGFAAEADWSRAYSEINDFEAQLTRHGVILVKLWLQVGKAEQLRRFKERENTEWKRFKIGPEDWRNREKWEAYELAVGDMVDRTSTADAPWTLVESDDKYWGRVKVLRTVVETLQARL